MCLRQEFAGPLAQGVLDNKQLTLSPRMSPVPDEVCWADIFDQLYNTFKTLNQCHLVLALPGSKHLLRNPENVTFKIVNEFYPT